MKAQLLLISKQVEESGPLRGVQPSTVGREMVPNHWSTVVRSGAPGVDATETTLNMSEREVYIWRKKDG